MVSWITQIFIIVLGGFVGYYMLIALGNEHRANMIRFFLILLIVVVTLEHAGPAIGRVSQDYKEVNQNVKDLTGALNTVGTGVQKVKNGVDVVTSWPETKENIPIIGTGASKAPPGLTIKEKLMPSSIRFNVPVQGGSISQPFKGEDHHGIDIAVNVGTPVKASREGTVCAINHDDIYGDYVMIDHGGGWQTLYAHLSKIMVTSNQHVWGDNRDTIGLSGGLKGAEGSGNSQGPHLHFEIRVNKQAIDPQPMLK